MTALFSRFEADDFEQVVFCQDRRTGLKAIIAIHSTALGPAVGGCRMWDYASDAEALEDSLRLSKGMTYKASLAGLNWGGGKSVILGDSKHGKTPALLKRFGEYVDRLNGNYVTAKDVGIGGPDLQLIQTRTKHVLGIEGVANSSGDPSPATGFGVYCGVRAAAQFAFGSASLKGKRIAVQGLGSVAYYMLEHAVADGATVIACDISSEAIERAVKKFGVEIVAPEAIYDVPCDIFSPNALGATINPATLPRIKAKVIAGGANNQLATAQDGFALMERGILYAPDYAINAGGLINIYHEGSDEARARGGYDKKAAFAHTAEIEQTLLKIFERAKAERLPTHVVADRMAEERVQRAREAKLAAAAARS